jgi:hypothetical protein
MKFLDSCGSLDSRGLLQLETLRDDHRWWLQAGGDIIRVEHLEGGPVLVSRDSNKDRIFSWFGYCEAMVQDEYLSLRQ